MTKPSSLLITPTLTQDLIVWFYHHRRALPWRESGQRDPYRVWVSEIMLQQTVAATVIPYYHRFLARWPDLASLGAADLDDILLMWQGLGYYRRARHMHACARQVMAVHGGRFPDSVAALRTLPGIGAYTAAALAALAFGVAICPIDGNVTRVMSRLTASSKPLGANRRFLDRIVQSLVPADCPGDFAEALMDLGATLCSPRKPNCSACPLSRFCCAHQAGNPEAYPVKPPPTLRPQRYGVAFYAYRSDDDALLLYRNDDHALLSGLWALPATAWTETLPTQEQIAAAAPLTLNWQSSDVVIRHQFTHFRLHLQLRHSRVDRSAALRCGDRLTALWLTPEQRASKALSTLMRNAIAAIEKELTPAQGG